MLKEVLKSFNDSLKRAGLKMNVDKTEIMIISREKENNVKIKIEGTEIKNNEKLKYLGSMFTSEGG
jgi:hypothetical protein